jgi:hypothetical protein
LITGAARIRLYLQTVKLEPKGIKVTDEEMEELNIIRNDFHGDWNYEILPRLV